MYKKNEKRGYMLGIICQLLCPGTLGSQLFIIPAAIREELSGCGSYNSGALGEPRIKQDTLYSNPFKLFLFFYF